MAQLTQQQSVDLVRKAIAKAILDRKPAIVAAMKRNGIIVSPSVSDKDLSIMVFEAVNRSTKFQKELAGVLYSETQVPGFLNQTGEELTQAPGDKRAAWTQVAALGIDTGLKLISNRINQKQADKDRLAAIQYNASEVERLKAQIELEQSRRDAAPKTPVLTYVIVGVVAVAAVVGIVMLVRRKK
jgi:cobalamin biosynthesis Mg chelatase CobN